MVWGAGRNDRQVMDMAVLLKSYSVIYQSCSSSWILLGSKQSNSMMGRPWLVAFWKPLSFRADPFLHPVVRQINSRNGTKDQDDWKTKEGGLHILDIHHRALVVTVMVWVLHIDIFNLRFWVLLPTCGWFSPSHCYCNWKAVNPPTNLTPASSSDLL